MPTAFPPSSMPKISAIAKPNSMKNSETVPNVIGASVFS